MPTTTAALTYRRLPPEEWGKLDYLLALHNRTAPPQAVSSAYVAEDESGAVLLVCFLTLAMHFENLLGLPGAGAAGASVGELHRAMERELISQIPPDESLTYYTNVRDDPKVLAAAARHGLIPMMGFIPHHKSIGKVS